MTDMSVEKMDYTMLDTHRLVKRLVGTGMPEQQAEAVVDVHVQVVNSNLATKDDLKLGLAGVKVEMVRWVVGSNIVLFVGLAGMMVGLAGLFLNR